MQSLADVVTTILADNRYHMRLRRIRATEWHWVCHLSRGEWSLWQTFKDHQEWYRVLHIPRKTWYLAVVESNFVCAVVLLTREERRSRLQRRAAPSTETCSLLITQFIHNTRPPRR
jgi:hypothetical protein